MSWIDKYKPKQKEELLLTPKNFNKINNWINDFKNKKTDTNCLFLYGPSGSGKTICAHTFLKNNNYKIIEFNSSEMKKKNSFIENLNDILNKKNIMNMFNKDKQEIAIIMDEIEGINIGEKTIFKELLTFIFPKNKSARYLKYNPFILISNKLDKKQKNLISKCIFIDFEYPSFELLKNLSIIILDKEKISYDKKDLKKIIQISNNDIRQVIINLEYHYIKNDNKNVSSNKKDLEINDYKFIEHTLSNYISFNNSFILENKNLLFMIFYENFVNYIILKLKEKKYESILNIYKNYSDSDILDYNIYKKQCWNLIEYNYIYKITINSFIINCKIKNKCKHKINLNYSTFLNKNSLEYINLKLINYIQENLFKHSKSLSIQEITKILNIFFEKKDGLFFKHYKINLNDIKKIQKFLI